MLWLVICKAIVDVDLYFCNIVTYAWYRQKLSPQHINGIFDGQIAYDKYHDKGFGCTKKKIFFETKKIIFFQNGIWSFGYPNLMLAICSLQGKENFRVAWFFELIYIIEFKLNSSNTFCEALHQNIFNNFSFNILNLNKNWWIPRIIETRGLWEK